MRGKISCGISVVGMVLAVATVPQRAASRRAQNPAEEPVPALHAAPPQRPHRATLSPTVFGAVVVQNAYAVAARVKKILSQQLCYCHCDRSQGHGSLLDCFASKHGAGCNICIDEDFYSYEQSRKGKTPAQIRSGIIKGEWQSVDLTKYQQPRPAK